MEKESLLAILKGEVPGAVQAESYYWERIWGRKDIVEYGEGREIKGTVTIAGEPSRDVADLGYGSRYLGSTEGVEFTDGSCLVCATISEFAGTFASHDSIEVQYFVLEPWNKATKRKARVH